ncbi:MAG: hypothetical protein A2Y15_09900 [Clostridiales bacterium GWF2_36_10]|nr:MAG: hypothetical protein A2Y15_09900 [Clostridiales bacterium GWF2_36_10]HAN20182.1 hypothetical protein [Clostridiales bacterium]
MKKIISIMLVLFIMLSIATVAVSANNATANNNYTSETVAISASGASFTYQLRLMIVQELVDRTNAKIEKLVEKAIADTNPDLDKLVEKTNRLAQNTIKIAAILGIEVVCEYKAYEINGVIVYIDPLIVIKR